MNVIEQITQVKNDDHILHIILILLECIIVYVKHRLRYCVTILHIVELISLLF